MASTAPHLDQLELADSLRDHVFTLVRAGEMNAALILIRADVHSAVVALTAAADAKARAAAASVTPGGGETDEAEESGEPGSGEAAEADGQQQDPKDMDLAKKAPAR